jgi:hypothetical protein
MSGRRVRGRLIERQRLACLSGGHESDYAEGRPRRGQVRGVAARLRDHANGGSDRLGFTRRSVWELRQLLKEDRKAFLDAIDLPSGAMDCRITGPFSEASRGPRRILATALKPIAEPQGDEPRRPSQDRGRRAASLWAVAAL